jgi:hypothetical protein
VASPLITWENVTDLDASFADVTEARQAQILAQVAREVFAGVWGDKAFDGQLYLAAHLGVGALTSGGSTGSIASESVGSVSVSYAVPTTNAGALASTGWGQEFDRLRKSLPARFGVGFC